MKNSLYIFCLLPLISLAQNVGIGITAPVANLMINSNSGFSNPQLLLRQTNTADWARIRMQTGTTRYWDVAGFVGAAAPNDRLNFYHNTTGDILTLSGNGYVGIANSNPLAPLTFGTSIGRKIVLYPGASGNVGFGVYNNEFRIHTDYDPADITFGYENLAGVFTERFRFKGNGALAVGGNTGASGQVLTSNGNAALSWITPLKPAVSIFNQTSNTTLTGTGLEFEVAGLNGTFFVNSASTVCFTGNLNIVSANAAFTSFGWAEVRIYNGVNLVATARSTGSMDPLRKTTLNPTGAIALPIGIYTVKGFIGRLNVADLPNLSFAETPSQVIMQVFPQ